MPLEMGLAPATTLRPAAIYSVEFDRFYATEAVMMICTMCFQRHLWRSDDRRFQYADLNMNEAPRLPGGASERHGRRLQASPRAGGSRSNTAVFGR